MTEHQLEQEALGWLDELGYTHVYGPDSAFDGSGPERENYRQVLLDERLRSGSAMIRTSGSEELS